MTRIAVVAPAAFGEAGRAFLDGAASALEERDATCALVAGNDSLAQALEPLAAGDVVLGSLGSELAAEVAHEAAARGLVHVEAGALGDEALGPSTFRLTPARRELARAAVALAAGLRVGIVVEPSVFGSTMRAALEEALVGAPAELAGATEISEVLDAPPCWRERSDVEVVVAALRGDLTERLVAALAAGTRTIRIVGAAGAWTRTEVGRAARAGATTVVFCEVVAPSLARTPADGVGHGLYEDLGCAAGALVALALADGRPAHEAFAGLDLSRADSPLGYGVRFDPAGRNVRAQAALLQWKDGLMTSYEPGGPT